MKRERYIDEAKGLGILSITFLHYVKLDVLPVSFIAFLGMFAVPIFYVVAGWIMAMKDPGRTTKELCRLRLRSLGLPYLYWTAIILVFDCILWAFGYYDSYYIGKEIYKTVVLRGIGTLWFLPALFFGEIAWNLLRRKKGAWWLSALIIFIAYHHFYGAFFSGKETSMWKIIQAPFYTVNSALTAIQDVAIGFLAYKGYRKIRLSVRAELIVGVLLCCLGFYFTSNLDDILGPLYGYLWPLITPVVCSVGFILLFKALQNSRLLNYFDFWGRNSLSLMVTNYSIIQVLLIIFVTRTLRLEPEGWIAIGMFAVAMPVQYLIALLLNRRFPSLLHPKIKK